MGFFNGFSSRRNADSRAMQKHDSAGDFFTFRWPVLSYDSLLAGNVRALPERWAAAPQPVAANSAVVRSAQSADE
jgi:hypothetical protein